MYKNMPELLEERENNGWKLEKFEIKQGNFRAMVDGIMPGTYITKKSLIWLHHSSISTKKSILYVQMFLNGNLNVV